MVPNDNFQEKVGAAAGQKALPDILASDVVYAANYTRQGLYQPIGDRIDSLPFADSLAKAHIEAGTYDGKRYVVPHKVDSSFIFYNKDLFKKAGLDPENPPTTYDGIYQAAKAITGLGDGVYGFSFDGNCAGCLAYTVFPFADAGGHPPISRDGAKADLANPAMTDILGLYKKLYDDGLVDPSAKTADGTSWQEMFIQGKAGIWPNGSYSIPRINEEAKFDWGYMPIANADGSATSTFVGGDVLGISSSSDKADAAWDFIAWSLSDEAQKIVVKNGDLPVRTDLADTADDPRMKAIIAGLAHGYTPSTVVYGEAVNDSNGPWLQAARGAIFGNDAQGSLTQGQTAIQALIDNAG